jgi:uncharacterized membrane protein YadS
MIFNKFHYSIYYGIPLIVTGIVVGVWYVITKGYSPPLGATIGGFTFIFLVIPVYLIVCNIYMQRVGFSKKALYSLLTISACMMIDYSIWGALSGQFLTPDTATVTMLQNGISISGAIVFGMLLVREIFDAF